VKPRAVTTSAARARVVVLASAIIAAASLLLLAGCGSVGHIDESQGDRQQGRELFIAHCGQCHTLAAAGTQGQIGPNLDDGFRQARKDRMPEETVLQVVRDQIQYPIDDPVTGVTGMPGIDETLPECKDGQPQGCVEDQDEAANSVAVYVASVAGVEGAAAPQPTQPPPPPSGGPPPPAGGAAEGKQVFESAGCGSCHTLADAGTSGTIGPNLDEAMPSKALAIDRVTNGRGAMPPFKGQLTEAQIDAVATYVSSVAGK
jgi:mono/diheme cytochrome c family protein